MAIEFNSKPLSRKEIEQLPRNARIALAARCAWRVMPATGARGDFKFWGEEAPKYLRTLEMLVFSLVLSTVSFRVGQKVSLKGEPLVGIADLAEVIHLAKGIAKWTVPFNLPVDWASAISIAYWAAFAATSTSADIAYVHAATVDAMVVNAASAVAVRSDFQWLMEYLPRGMETVPRSFFDQPLWPHGEPRIWKRVCKTWNAVLRSTDINLAEIYSRHQRALAGKNDWKELSQVIQEWTTTYANEIKHQIKAIEASEIAFKTKSSPSPTYLIPGAATPGIDQPAEKDSLNRGSLVSALAQMFIAMDNPRGMTIALLADWGTGKSTVFELLKKQLSEKPRRFIFSEFNAWKYEQSANIPAGMAHVISQDLLNSVRWWRRWISLPLAFLCLMYREKITARISWLLLLGGSAYGLWRTVQSYWPYLVPSWLDMLGNKNLLLSGGAISIAAAATVLFKFATAVKKISASDYKAYMQMPSYTEHLGLIPLFRRHLKTLCRLTLSSTRRLVLIVDDLDRCQPEYISNVFDAIRLVMDLDHVIVLVGIDHRIAFKAMELRYEKLADGDRTKCEIARDYLGKIVHLPIRLLPLRKDELEHYIGDCLFANIALEEPPAFIPEAPAARPDEIPASADVGGQAAATAAQDPQNDGSNSPAPSKSLGQSDTLEPLASQTPLTVEFDPPVQASHGLSAEELRRAMQDLPVEHGWFSQLAQQYEFSNPRQLLRLRNSYRLLKAVALNDYPENADRQAFEASVLQMLFWQEFLHTMPRAARHRCVAALAADANLSQLEPAKAKALNMTVSELAQVRRVLENVRATMAAVFKNELRAAPPLGSPARNYADLARWVRSVVLPHSEEGVLDTQDEIEAWIKTL